MAITYLHITEKECQRCNHRWTDSYLVTPWDFPLAPSTPVSEVPFYIHSRQRPNACHNCLSPTATERRSLHAHNAREFNSGIREPPAAEGRISGSKEITLSDLLKD